MRSARPFLPGCCCSSFSVGISRLIPDCESTRSPFPGVDACCVQYRYNLAPERKIALGLDIKGGTSFLIKLQQLDKDKPITPGLLDQAVEVIRKRVDYFGAGEPIISPVGQDRILVQIPGLDTAKIQEAREQLSKVAKLEFRLVYPDNGERLGAIDKGTEVVPPEYKIENYKHVAEENEKATTERLLVKKKADLGGDRVSESHAFYGNEGWTVQLKFDGDGAKNSGKSRSNTKVIVSPSSWTELFNLHL